MTFPMNPNVRCFREGEEPVYQRFINRPPLETKSRVAVVRGQDYGQADTMVRKALELLTITEVCGKRDQVLIKPNIVLPSPPEMAETTHPNVVAAMVKICKETGARVTVGDSCAWDIPMDLVLETTRVKAAALEAGADEVVDFAQVERVDVEVPNARAIKIASIPRCVVEADVVINLPKMKNNFVTLTTLGIKNMLGMLPAAQRHPYHRTPWDMAWATNDLFKIVKDKHRLTLIDGIVGVEGATHLGTVCRPGVIVASRDPIAAEAVTNTIMGYNPLESPHVQVGMKDGLGTGDLVEIEIVGAKLEEVIYPFQRSMLRFVSEYPNVTEFYGGACHACLWAAVAVPPVVDSGKKYAVIAGTRAFIAKGLHEFDEAWLVGTCACNARQQFPGYLEKIRVAKKTVRMPTCPGWTHLIENNMFDPGRFVEIPDVIRREMLEQGRAGIADIYDVLTEGNVSKRSDTA